MFSNLLAKQHPLQNAQAQSNVKSPKLTPPPPVNKNKYEKVMFITNLILLSQRTQLFIFQDINFIAVLLVHHHSLNAW